MKRPQLLSPAGSLRSLNYALAYGADAVYAGLPRYSLRARNNEFRNTGFLREGIEACRAAGKRFYLTVNLMAHNRKVNTFINDLRGAVELGPDALIMADPGLIMMVRETWPEVPVHLSVQANTVNYASVRFWNSIGVSRVILSRELSLDEIAEIRQRCPDTELEVFVHGALCIAYSGRCLLSGYFNHRDSNQGTCTNACRWSYRMTESTLTPEGEHVPRHAAADRVYLLEEEERRSGDWMELSEDEHGTYLMNSRDLRAIEHVQRLVDIGVDCLKIEGRTKSHYYVARTAQLYARAIDDAIAGRPFDAGLVGRLDGLANRGYTDGFLQRHRSEDYQNYASGASGNARQQFVGEWLAYDEASGLTTLEVKNRFAVGDRVEVVSPNATRDVVIEHVENMEGTRCEVAPGSGHVVRVALGPTSQLTLVARYGDTPTA
ncbi:MAG: tRNA 5-hydroxyuridine modification protein YegQ [Rhodocyclaceae bacterium]